MRMLACSAFVLAVSVPQVVPPSSQPPKKESTVQVRGCLHGQTLMLTEDPGFEVPDKAMCDAYAAAGVDRQIVRPRPDMDVAALERFAADTGRALGR